MMCYYKIIITFYDVLESILLSSDSINSSETYIFGDFNTDVSSKNRCPLRRKLNSLCDMFSLKQVINDYTRISEFILVYDPVKVAQSGVVDCCVNDHLMVFCRRKTSRELIDKHNTVTLRSLKNYSKESFQQSLIGSDWTPVFISDNVNVA